jgi:GNAT superfamily N-acetyltransferase
MDRQQRIVGNDPILVQLVETKFRTDDRGKLKGDAPHLYILRTPELVICRCHADLADEIATTVEELSVRPREWAREYADYLGALSSVGPLTSMRVGQLYRFPDMLALKGTCISIVEGNTDLLRGGLDEWLPDVAVNLPMIAMVADGRAVSICTSVIASKAVHEAGVETLPDYRRRGLGVQAVAGWARTVQASGAVPFYATTFDNVASQRLAARLGLSLVGAEFSLTCCLDDIPSCVATHLSR